VSLLNALPALVLHERSDSGRVGALAVNLERAGGVAIYYPPRAGAKTYRGYAQGDLTFTTDTLWDEFLAVGLVALPFDPSDPEPRPVAPPPLIRAVFAPLARR
jgi:hypothetical protein